MGHKVATGHFLQSFIERIGLPSTSVQGHHELFPEALPQRVAGNHLFQFWYDGVPQRFADGSDTYTGTTYDGTSDYLKWGVYHPAPGTGSQWFTSPRMATSLAVEF